MQLQVQFYNIARIKIDLSHKQQNLRVIRKVFLLLSLLFSSSVLEPVRLYIKWCVFWSRVHRWAYIKLFQENQEVDTPGTIPTQYWTRWGLCISVSPLQLLRRQAQVPHSTLFCSFPPTCRRNRWRQQRRTENLPLFREL